MSKIVILAHKYPTKNDPTACTFIQQFAWQLADMNHDVIVINPVSVLEGLPRMAKLCPKYSVERTENNSRLNVVHPRYINLGQTQRYFGKTLAPITSQLFYIAAKNAINWKKEAPDAIYAHFIIPAGIAASKLSLTYGTKSFLGHGEALFVADKKMGGVEKLASSLSGITGVIAVSEQNKEYLTSRNLFLDNQVRVFPNGYRPERFFKESKINARKKIGIATEDFLVGYVGRFDKEKGISRLVEAVDRLNGVKLACAGKGPLVPKSDSCIFCEAVSNDELVHFYNSIDAFVLPTECEGCCNAIIEAMACGCPIISSNRDFNKGILDSRNSILIDPDDVSQIAAAIQTLRNDPIACESLSEGSLNSAHNLVLDERVKRICRYMGV